MSEPWYKTPLGRAVLAALPEPKAKRAFSAAQASPLTASWGSQPTHVNFDLQSGLRSVRARSRDLERNNDYARKFLSMVETNVVGHAGFSLFVEPKRPDGSVDTFDAGRIEAEFTKWSRECEVSGLTLTEVERLFIRTVARDGECGVRFMARGPYKFQIQLIDPEMVDVNFNADVPGGGKVRMGVEYDAQGAVTAYHLSATDTADPRSSAVNIQRQRVPADEMKLYFPRMQIGQLRGVPFMASAMLRMQMLGGYEEAAVVAARVGAAKMGVIKTPDGDYGALGDETVGNTTMIDSAEPGGFFNLPAGAELQNWNPEYPHAQFGDFVRATLRGISSGLGVSYATLANDLENVNYSSIRAGVLEEREVWKALQGWMIEAFLAPMFTQWLKMALTSGKLDPLPASKFDKFNSARWQGRRWDWVDPEKDINASILAIKHGLKSRSEIVSQQGRDLGDVWSDLAQEQAEAAAKGIVLLDINEAEAAKTKGAAPMPAPGAPAREIPSSVVNVSTVEHPETAERVAALVAPALEKAVEAFGARMTDLEAARSREAAEREARVRAAWEDQLLAVLRSIPKAPEYEVVESDVIYREDGRPKGTRTLRRLTDKAPAPSKH